MKSNDLTASQPLPETGNRTFPLVELNPSTAQSCTDDRESRIKEISLEVNESHDQPDSPDVVCFDDKTVPLTTEAIFAEQEPAKELVGERLEKFRIDDIIAHGGMGIILKAFDLELEREVAVKLLLKTHQRNSELQRQFTNEARITGRLQHPGIIPIYETSNSPDGRPFFAMKLVRGKTLADLLLTRSSPDEDLPRLLKIFEQVCHTLSYTHSQGVIHLDIKPTNIMVGAFGEVHLMDWGLARSTTELCRDNSSDAPDSNSNCNDSTKESELETPGHNGTFWGTLAYMSPEQARGHCTDVRSDVFGLGGILCEILTGSPPHQGRNLIDVCFKAARGDLVSAITKLTKCQADDVLVRLAIQCLATNPGDRPANATIVARELTLHLESLFKRAASDLERFFDLSLDLFCIAGLDGYFRRVNSNFPRVLGHSEKELTSRPFLDFVHPDDREPTLAVMGQLLQGMPVVRFQNRYLAANGTWRRLEWMAKSIPDDGIIFAVARDVTDQ